MIRMLIAIAVLLVPINSMAEDFGGNEKVITSVDAAIKHIATKGLPKFKIFPYRKSPMIDDSNRRALSEAIAEASNKYAINPMLLVAIAYREGGFKNSAVGKRKEKATFQISPRNIPWLQSIEPNCNLDDYRGSAYCSAALLNYDIGVCKGVRGALLLYVTGRTCASENDHSRWLMDDRLSLASTLSKMFPISQ